MQTIPLKLVRDFPVPVCQAWSLRYVAMFGEQVPLFPKDIFLYQNGVARVYRNPSTNPEINAVMLKKANENPGAVPDFIESHLPLILLAEKICARETFDHEGLLQLISLVYDCWPVHYLSIFIPMDERFSEADRKIALAFRKKYDQLEYRSFNAVDTALKQAYPDMWPAIRYATREELTAEALPAKEVLEQRMHGTFYVIDGNILSESEFQNIAAAHEFILEAGINPSGISEVKGQIACKGLARGVVQILLKNEEVSKFIEGNILVTSMTVPTFLPAMKKAAAFVTDEGGITSHAAIIAREMNKPCIIGTKIATQVFKDGDMVEVDAEAGIARKV